MKIDKNLALISSSSFSPAFFFLPHFFLVQILFFVLVLLSAASHLNPGRSLCCDNVGQFNFPRQTEETTFLGNVGVFQAVKQGASHFTMRRTLTQSLKQGLTVSHHRSPKHVPSSVVTQIRKLILNPSRSPKGSLEIPEN